MRVLAEADEMRLMDALQRRAKSYAGGALELVVFDGSLSIADTIELFARARIVVGVHGGALSNVLFCPKGALLVELTVDSPYTRHYEHAAVALGLEYVGIPLVRDERGVGANDVRIDDVGHDAVRDAVATHRFPQP